jgi:uncharacterized membrane protein YedE/YeeE
VRTRKSVVAFVSGLIFAVGLGISGMTQPEKVLGFLNLFGAWDPTLAFVMIGAIAVHMPVSLWVKRQGMFLPAVPCAGDALAGPEPLAPRIDVRLLGGSAIFGVGWGLAGYCPGPAIVSVASGARAALVFAAAMIAGTALFRFTIRRRVPSPQW